MYGRKVQKEATGDSPSQPIKKNVASVQLWYHCYEEQKSSHHSPLSQGGSKQINKLINSFRCNNTNNTNMFVFLIKVREFSENGVEKWSNVRRQKREWIKFAAACRENEDNSRRNPIARVCSKQIKRTLFIYCNLLWKQQPYTPPYTLAKLQSPLSLTHPSKCVKITVAVINRQMIVRRGSL